MSTLGGQVADRLPGPGPSPAMTTNACMACMASPLRRQKMRPTACLAAGACPAGHPHLRRSTEQSRGQLGLLPHEAPTPQVASINYGPSPQTLCRPRSCRERAAGKFGCSLGPRAQAPGPPPFPWGEHEAWFETGWLPQPCNAVELSPDGSNPDVFGIYLCCARSRYGDRKVLCPPSLHGSVVLWRWDPGAAGSSLDGPLCALSQLI